MKNKTTILVKKLYKIVAELESIHDNRPFTPDGHLVGSIGECLISKMFNLELMPPSNKGYDAIDKKGRKVEIKVTQSTRVAFRHSSQYAIVGVLNKDGNIDIIFNGPGRIIWNEFKNKKLPSNGQYQIGINKLTELNKSIGPSNRI